MAAWTTRVTGVPLLPSTPAGSEEDVPVVIDRDAAREAAERELSRQEYREHEPGVLRRFLDWLFETAERLLSSTADLAPGGWVGLLTVVLVVVALLVALRLRLGAIRRPETGAQQALFADGPLSAAEHRAAAERLAAEERWNEALQERMRAVVRSLEERALLSHRPGRTAGEAATEAGREIPHLATELRTAAGAFDEVTYARRATDASAYAQLRDLDRKLATSRPEPTTSAPPRSGV